MAGALGRGRMWTWTSARRRRQRYQAMLGERGRVARELHDTLEQGLAGIGLQLEAVAGTLARRRRRPPPARSGAADAPLQRGRSQAVGPRSPIAGARVIGPGRRARRNGARDDLGVGRAEDVRVIGPPRRLDAKDEHHLLRIGLEAVTNALKHAKPGRIDMEVQFTPGQVVLTVHDDGCGLGAGNPRR